MSASFTIQGMAVKIRVHGKKRPHVIEKANGRLEGVVPKGMPYPVAVAILKPMVEEFLRKRVQPTVPDSVMASETASDRHQMENSSSSTVRDPGDYFPASGELELNIKDIPIHVTFTSEPFTYLRIRSTGRVEAHVTGGSRRKDVLDFFVGNIERIQGLIEDLRNIDISDTIIYYDNSNTISSGIRNIDCISGVLVYVKYSNKGDTIVALSNQGEIRVEANANTKISEIISIVKQDMPSLKFEINDRYADLKVKLKNNELVRPCILAYKDFLVEVTHLRHGLFTESDIRSDGVIKFRVPFSHTIKEFVEYFDKREDELRKLLGITYFYKPNEKELLASLETVDTLARNVDASQSPYVKAAAFERAKKYLGKGEYTLDVDGIEVKVVVSNVKVGQLRVDLSGIPVVDVPPHSRKPNVLNYVRENFSWLQQALEEMKSRPPLEFLKPGRTTYEGYTVVVEFDGRRRKSCTMEMLTDGSILFKAPPKTPQKVFLKGIANFVRNLQEVEADCEGEISLDKDGNIYRNGMNFWLWGEKYVLNVVEDDFRANVRDVKVDKDRKAIEIPVCTGHLRQLAWYVTEWMEQCIAIRGRQYLDKWSKELGITSVSLHVRQMKTKWCSYAEMHRRITVNTDLVHRDPMCLEYFIASELRDLPEASESPNYAAINIQIDSDWLKIKDGLEQPFPPADIGI
ncbi:MAG: M48 family metallopeptidase [Desulfovibrio sp.]|jgi:predicted metal-dependent hydrolase|nr:M48 family metallopeptidase [Desulfovibrio sp.]